MDDVYSQCVPLSLYIMLTPSLSVCTYNTFILHKTKCFFFFRQAILSNAPVASKLYLEDYPEDPSTEVSAILDIAHAPKKDIMPFRSIHLQSTKDILRLMTLLEFYYGVSTSTPKFTLIQSKLWVSRIYFCVCVCFSYALLTLFSHDFCMWWTPASLYIWEFYSTQELKTGSLQDEMRMLMI